MSSSWQVLSAHSLREAPLVAEPFPYLIVDNLIRPEVLAEVVESFPRIDKRGSFPPEAVSCSGRFATLMQEMHSVELRDLIGERLGMDLDRKSTRLNSSHVKISYAVFCLKKKKKKKRRLKHTNHKNKTN